MNSPNFPCLNSIRDAYCELEEEKVAKKLIVVGAGVGGLAAAAFMARRGWDVKVLEKNGSVGGRARVWSEKGFHFDMGPSWYLMPEVFERFFARFGRERQEFYTLRELSPYYRVFFGPRESVDITPDRERTFRLFESFEPGGAERLRRYLERARHKYEVAMQEFLYRDYSSPLQFLNARMLLEGSRLNVFGRLDRSVSRHFHDRRARQILEYHMVFLGTSPRQAPALYSIMSHVDLNLGVRYPLGGLAAVAGSIGRLAQEQGVEVRLDHEVRKILVQRGRASGVLTDQGELKADAVLVNADYAFAEQRLLDPAWQSLPAPYWERRVLAPSMFILYLGLDRTLPGLAHHNLYFAPQWERHFDAIFQRPSWPEQPCFYLSCISKTDSGMAPPGHENVFVLVPVAAGMADDEGQRERYADETIRHIERITGESIRPSVVVRRIFSQRDFAQEYNAYRGTALGLAHTLRQTAVFRPQFRSRRVSNLFYAGQYTHPGIGVPMVLIAAEVVAGLMAGASEGEGRARLRRTAAAGAGRAAGGAPGGGLA
jgi:phytoene desaturase